MPSLLRDRMQHFVAFLKGGGLWWGIGLTLAAAVLTLLIAIAIVLAWRPDHFKEGRARGMELRHPVVRLLGLVAKNVAGVLLIALGLLMELPGIPGQGFLTIIIGITLLDFPGKRRIERRLIGRPAVL